MESGLNISDHGLRDFVIRGSEKQEEIMKTLKDVLKMVDHKITVKVPEWFSQALEETQKARTISGPLVFAGINEFLEVKQVTIDRTPVRVNSWDDVSIYVE